MGGARCGGGSDAAGLSENFLYWGIHVLYWRYVGQKLSQIFSNFHFFFFGKFLQKISGVPDAAGLSDTFLVLEILVEKNLSQIFSNFLGIHFYVLAMAENYFKFSQIFTFFHFFHFFFAKKFRDARCGRSVGYIFSIGNFGTKYLPHMMASRSGGGYR